MFRVHGYSCNKSFFKAYHKACKSFFKGENFFVCMRPSQKSHKCSKKKACVCCKGVHDYADFENKSKQQQQK